MNVRRLDFSLGRYRVLWVPACSWWKVKPWVFDRPEYPFAPRVRGIDLGRLRFLHFLPDRPAS